MLTMAGRSPGELGAMPVSPRSAPAAGPGKRGNGASAGDYGWQGSPAMVTVVPRVPFLPALAPAAARSSWTADDPDGIFSRKPESPIFGRKGHTHPARPAGVRLDHRFDAPASPIAINNASTPGAGATSPPPGALPVRQHLAPSPLLQKYKVRTPCDVTEAARLAGYVLGDVLATGGFSTVRRGRSANDDQEVAIKILDTLQMDDEAHDALANEVALWSRLRHPHIVQLLAVVETPTTVLMVMELVEAGPLLEHINSAEDGRLTEDAARPIFRQLLLALQHCHNQQVVHGDIKPENVLLTGSGHVKLGDFGFCYLAGNVNPEWLTVDESETSSAPGADAHSAHDGDDDSDTDPQFGSVSPDPQVFALSPPVPPVPADRASAFTTSAGAGPRRGSVFAGRTVSDGLALALADHQQRTPTAASVLGATPMSLPSRAVFSGTPQYAAPEVLRWREDTGTGSDMWSTGVTLYAAVTGCLPFADDYEPRLHQTILGGRYELPDHLTPACRDLLTRMLHVDTARRISAAEALAHAWFFAKC